MLYIAWFEEALNIIEPCETVKSQYLLEQPV